MGWSRNLYTGLAALHSDIVLFMQEDFFICGPVDEAYIIKAIRQMQQHSDISCFRLMPCPGPDKDIDADHGQIAQDAPYRVSCQAALWRREDLMGICQRTTSPGSFEIEGTRLASDLRTVFLSVRRDRNPWPLPYLVSAVSRGLWNPDAITLCNKLKIPIDTENRPVEPH